MTAITYLFKRINEKLFVDGAIGLTLGGIIRKKNVIGMIAILLSSFFKLNYNGIAVDLCPENFFWFFIFSLIRKPPHLQLCLHAKVIQNLSTFNGGEPVPLFSQRSRTSKESRFPWKSDSSIVCMTFFLLFDKSYFYYPIEERRFIPSAPIYVTKKH